MIDLFWFRLGPLVLCACLLPLAAAAAAPRFRVDKAIDVGPVWSGIPVEFVLITQGDRQYVAFYDAERRMTVAARTLDAETWEFARLPQEIGWDAHNYLVMAVDDDGHLHLAGNMHAIPLVYFRTSKPQDIRTFERVPVMVGRDEERCTYPRFLRGPKGELLFTYRSGRAGDGEQIWNVYDHADRTWKRLLDQPLISGRGRMNAYPHGPVLGSDGYYHLVWVWRDKGGCEFNHDLCYARSPDLIRWETSSGCPLTLPITIETAEIVDPVPVKFGMLNGNTRLGFDSRRRPIISYHKFDDKGFTQLYNARLEDGRWQIYQTSRWDYRWEFAGGGSIASEIGFGPVRANRDEGLTQWYSHIRYGSDTWRLDEATLRPIGSVEVRPSWPAELETVRSQTPGMKVRWSHDAGKPAERNSTYILRWETLDCNRDKPRDVIPPPTMLTLYKLVRNPSGRKGTVAIAGHPPPASAKTRPAKPVIKKLGTIDCDMVETTPVVWKGRLYRFEYVRERHWDNKTGKSYFRFIDVQKDEPTPPFAVGYHLGSAHVEGETMYVFGVNAWDGDTIQVFWSKDLKTWSERTALKLPGWGLFNNSVCKGPDRYIMAFEVGRPPEVVGCPFTTRFAESQDLIHWKLIGEESVYTKDRYSACPTIRWLDGYYYMIYLEAKPGPTYEPYIVRTRDLIHWELSPLNPILRHGVEDKLIGNPKLTPAQRDHIAKAVNINNCDVDLCEFQGRTIICYCWGNQQGTEFLAHAVYEGTLKSFLQGFFP